MAGIAAIKYARKLVHIKNPIGLFMGSIEMLLQLSKKNIGQAYYKYYW